MMWLHTVNVKFQMKSVTSIKRARIGTVKLTGSESQFTAAAIQLSLRIEWIEIPFVLKKVSIPYQQLEFKTQMPAPLDAGCFIAAQYFLYSTDFKDCAISILSNFLAMTMLMIAANTRVSATEIT